MDDLTLNEYQRQAQRTAKPEWTLRDRLTMAALGATGEAGEFADMVKKLVYHEHDLNEDEIIKELGDILWYVTEAASALGYDLDIIARRNIRKLEKRYPQGFDVERSKNRGAE